MIKQPSNPTIHFIGIGGCGMNGVAQLINCVGYAVSGSDRTENPELFEILKNLDIEIFPQDGSGITEQTDFVVYSTAIEDDNPDRVRASELGIPLLHRAEMLAKLCEGKQVIAVAGTAGKSTVTGLLGWIFQCLEKDPTVYCGAPVLNWKKTSSTCSLAGVIASGTVENVGSPSTALASRPAKAGRTPSVPALQKPNEMSLGNVRFGNGPWIIEADESDKSFLNFHPDHAIITNIAEDHFELSELKQLFTLFESQVSGTVIKPDPSLDSAGGVALPDNFKPKGRAGLSERAVFAEEWPKAEMGSSLIGKHNTENIHNALRLCQALGLDMPKCLEAVSTFKGIERRLERHGPNVIDDFAHSPIKIAAALEAVSEVWPAFNAVWRPHGFTPLFQGLEGFIETFSNHWKKADPPPNEGGTRPPGAFGKLYILPVYYAGGTVNRKITSELFVEKLQAVGVPAEFVASFQGLEKRLLADKQPVLVMGARDPELPRFAKRIAAVIG